ncbi:cation-transporting P-type ATPase [uncultured Tateyamaria sp.]|uniref:cation-translocating P-type ATPase n=1 Tax=uncultured Tateyamaria sp. TaxID=455651 RepID=UPI0026130D9D|nr:cation-transporting P-type ATPase [uncultured Tateyamaria sp.]
MHDTQASAQHANGLTSDQIDALRQIHGWNELPRQKPPGWPTVLLRQFTSMLVLILAAAALIALALGEQIDALAIALVLLLNAALGFGQEWRAETALDALRSMLTPHAIAVRDGREVDILARELVPGDVVIISPGAAVPADLHILSGTELRADESVLTGESVPVDKTEGGDDETGQLFAGTALVEGRALGVVEQIGHNTRFGHIAKLTGTVGEKKTNLQMRLGQLAQQIGIAAIAVAAIIVGIGLIAGRPLFEMFMTGLSLAVAMVPEGLPAVVTITLAIGASAMARKKALARRLQAVETLGAASVICTDKTGTLTENQMTATHVWTVDRSYDVTGEGYDPTGHIETDGVPVRAVHDAVLADILKASLTCTHASLQNEDGHWHMIGAPTEGALVTLAFKGWAPPVAQGSLISETPFTSERKRMSVLARDGNDVRLFVKGAPEVVQARCTHIMTQSGPRQLAPADAALITQAYQSMAQDGLRVLSLALRDAGQHDTEEARLTFLGLVGMIDPPRAEIRPALRLARAAGIRVIMITGDGAITAAAIANQIGLGKPDLIEGRDIDAMDAETLAARLRGDVLFARTRPEHKLRIVKALQANGQIVAMTGDGVNDAPALKQANIGVAMGVRGTEVSKSAADLILLDDDFSTIVNAIGEGRRQFDNVRKFVRYLLSSNAGEVFAIMVNLMIGGPLIFLATQILWMNLITDSVTAVALGLEKEEPDQMQRPPRKPNEAILGRSGFALIAVFGIYTASASLWVFYTFMPLGVDLARTAAFTAMLIFEKVSVFAFRSLHRPVSAIGWFSNPVLVLAFSVSVGLQVLAVYWPPLQHLLRTVPLSPGHWWTICLLAAPLIILPELIKGIVMWRTSNQGVQA